jgi:hypothetical protein
MSKINQSGTYKENTEIFSFVGIERPKWEFLVGN